MIYLDTHIVVWLYAGLLDRVGDSARKLMNEDELVISPIVRLELQYLYEIGRITVLPETILTELSQQIGLTLCKKSFDSIISHAVKISWTRDPFDRLIVAHAQLAGALLISKDKTILEHYPFARE